MCILGAVLTDNFVVQKLTSYVWTAGNPYNDKEVESVACLFKALSVGLQDLQVFYGSVASASASAPESQCMFPFLRSYCHSPDHEVKFQYIDRLYNNKAVYLAESSDGRKLIIKFIQQYNSTAHHLLARIGFALTLHYSSLNRADIGGLGMMVMDFVDGKSAHEEYGDEKLPRAVYDQVKNAIDILHASSFVFGDLRLPNIIITNRAKPMLIDFDWCGERMIGRYPLSLNDSGSIAWHQEVKRNGIMSMDHNISMLDAMKPPESA